ncbi:Clathrin light chain [Elasticomyces elasticus]|nr:Clathrin light chain [Elasticomyces elasticus]KAK3636385.1 Clathrin light chain [Elasticomyces elasticus]KAK4916583.1 Clathrin light chain [Elasticomyces elasticus]KAK5756180.1 Clathrin light chain [Elasticomyces elasticus]
MADRFPSLDDFDAGQTTTSVPSSSTQPSDFLARERAALGDDADIFTSSNEPHNTATVADQDDDEDDDDLLGGGMNAPTNNNNNGGMGEDMMGDFESSFPAVDTQNDRVAPGGTITGSGALPYRGATHPDQASSNTNGYSDDTAEPDVVREWRERRDLAIQHRDEVSESRKKETIKAAQEAVDEFYENYNNKRDKSVAATRKEAEEFLKSREDTTSGGTSWERIAKLVDLTGKGSSGGAAGTGKAKMREMLLDLRKDEKAPGATGY